MKPFIIMMMLSFNSYAKDINYFVGSVYDGDTIKLINKKYQKPFQKISLRIYGVDTPELKRYKCEVEKELAEEAKIYVEGILENFKYKIVFIKWGKYGGRVIGDIIILEDSFNDGSYQISKEFKEYGGIKLSTHYYLITI